MTGGIGHFCERNLHWKTTVHLALEINDFRPSYIVKIMDLTDMCPGSVAALYTRNKCPLFTSPL